MRRRRRKTLIGAAVVAVIVLLIVLISGGRSENGYLVRAIFDNGSFLVPGEEVRVAGASVGTIQSVGVTMPGEKVSYENGRYTEDPGKAVLVLKINDAGFQDFRKDASCEIRPQSLIGEKYVDCRTTLPHAPGAEDASPPLREIPDGEPGAGQHLLPLQQNTTSVDPDLVNDIQRLPYAQRFRLIINELGGTLAGRGEDIEEAVKRSNPVLRDADRLFQILSNQRNQLAQLSSNSEEILEPFAAQRAHVAGFLSNSGATAEASAERGQELEASLKKLPGFINEFESTLKSLQAFATSATPVFGDLNRATPALTEATRALTPFSAAATVSLKSLGTAGEIAGPKFVEADPIVRKARNLAKSGVVPTSELARFLISTKKSKGFDALVDLIYNGAAASNEFDEYGHLLRTLVTIVDCAEYSLSGKSGCSANFTGPFAVESSISSVNDPSAIFRHIEEMKAEKSGGTAAGSSSAGPPPPSLAPSTPTGPQLGGGEELGPAISTTPSPEELMRTLGR
jgi:phospholipid/cholesterol/gamma-HCH transport system substrate-binding protein